MTAEPDFPWQIQLGPELTGSGAGFVLSSSVKFYVYAPDGDPSYVNYSTTAGSAWTAIPNNTSVHVDALNVHYRYAVPPGVRIKFLIGL